MTDRKKRGRPKVDAESRRAQILGAAIAAFADNGYANTDLQGIADAARIAKGTIYLYFKTKEDLFQAAVQHAIERLAEGIDGAVAHASGPVDKIKAVVSAYFRFYDADRRLVEIIARQRGEFMDHAQKTYNRVVAQNARHLEAVIREGVRLKLFRRVPPRVTAEIMANLLTGTVYTYMLGEKRGRAAGAIANVTDFLMHGILRKGTHA